MPLRFRIALAIAVLGSLLVGVVLWVTLGDLLARTRQQLRASEQVIMDLLADHAREALLTEEFGNLQVQLDRAARHPRLRTALVADVAGRVVVATNIERIGQTYAAAPAAHGDFWRTRAINGRINPLGTIAVEFSDRPYVAAHDRARALGLTVAGIGIVASTGIGLLIGQVLTARLHTLADAADRVGGHTIPTTLQVRAEGSDEVARLTRAFTGMLGRLQESYEALRAARDRLLHPTEAMSQGFVVWDVDDRLILRNRRIRELFKETAEHFQEGRSFPDVLGGAAKLVAANSPRDWCARRAAYHRNPEGVCLMPLRDGRCIEIRETRTSDGGTVGIYTDVTHERRQQIELIASERRLRVMMDSVFDAVITTDGRGRIDSLNPSAERIFGWSRADALGLPISVLMATSREDPGSPQATFDQLALLAPDSLCEWEGRHRDGRILPIEVSSARLGQGANSALLLTIRDISERKANELRIVYHATHDRLTTLPNRSLLEQRLEEELRRAQSDPQPLAIVFLDLDRFKVINDTLGHQVGDGVLIAVAERLRTLAHPPHTVARLGGDEFIILLLGDAATGACQFARRLLSDLRRPVQVRGSELSVTASVGISVYPEHGDSANALFKHADLALYQAKSSGKDRVCGYQPEMSVRGRRQTLMETQLRRALGRGELALHYQPQIDLATGEICCLEALTRWHHPDLGVVPPDEFIPIAEETALVSAIGRWVLDGVCRDALVWQQLGLGAPRVAINVSARELDEEGFAAHFLGTLERNGMAAGRIELELTERVLMRESARTLQHLEELVELGIDLTLDDFGTGYWSLGHLKRCPLRRLKIDRSLIQGLNASARDMPLIRATIAMAHALEIEVVAEGIEEAAQWKLLLEAGCKLGQGYFICRPQPLGEITALLARDPPIIAAARATDAPGNVLQLRSAGESA